MLIGIPPCLTLIPPSGGMGRGPVEQDTVIRAIQTLPRGEGLCERGRCPLPGCDTEICGV